MVGGLPYRVGAVLTDNALAFTMRHAHHCDRLTRFEQACRSLGIAHHLLRPRRPQSNGKVERFFRTVDDECLALQRQWTFGPAWPPAVKSLGVIGVPSVLRFWY